MAYHHRPFFILTLFLLLFTITIVPFNHANDYDQLLVANEDEIRSRIVMLDGNVYLLAGRDKNITFRVSNGSSIRFGDTDILQLPNSTEVRQVRTMLARLGENMEGLNQNVRSMDAAWSDKHADTLAKYRLLSSQFAAQLNVSQARARAGRRIRLLILKLSGQIERLFKLMSADECLGKPCLNGGTCVDGFGKYQCLCPSHYTGKTCEHRVDQCELYAGTDIGCKNNATCTNNPTIAGIVCNCTAGWHGRLCQWKSSACDSSMDVCGEHGHCLASKNNEAGYKCLCEPGFKLGGDPANPICVDVDECTESAPCYPGAECINLAGAFKCGSCPKGLIGNGINCHDFDECASDLTNDCAKEPRVECINSHGGYKCGPCPPDYVGDGFTCAKVSRCGDEQRICHADARCVEDPEFRCECPPGTVGDGIGPDGCEASNETLCLADSCLNGGNCQAISSTVFRCNCPEGFQGARCEHPSPCLSRTFCSGNGRCRTNPLGCDCHRGFYGPRCQYEEDDCGFHTSNQTGEIVYERTAKGPLLTRKVCTWHIHFFDTRKVLRIHFLNYTAPRLYELTSKSCGNSFVNLTIFDGDDPQESPQLASAQIANFCHGDMSAPSFQHPFYTSSNKATVRLSSRLQSRSTFLHLNWTAVEPRCGGRLSNPNGGRIDYFDVHEGDVCVWYVSVPVQFHVQLDVDVLRMPTGEMVNCSVNSLELYDSPSPTNRTRTRQLCASLTPADGPSTVRTSGPFAAVYLRLDSAQLGQDALKCNSPPCAPFGFSLRYSTIELPAGCGGEIFPDEQSGELEGELQSPNYPHTYFPNLDCLWVLHSAVRPVSRVPNAATPMEDAEEMEAVNGTNSALVGLDPAEAEDPYTADRKVELLFEHFDVPATITQYANPLLRHVTITSCSGDFLLLRELDMTFCNLDKPPKTAIAAPRISLKFHSDAAIGGSGFSLRYRTVCRRDFNAPNGTISPPNFPNASPRPFKCIYRIVAQPSQAIRIRFNQIGVSTNFTTCHYNRERHAQIQDYIELSGGHPSNDVANKRYVCPRYPFVAPMGEIVSSGTRPFSITYSTSGSASNRGFLFSYELIDIGCGGVFSIEADAAPNTQRQLASPNYPDAYMAHMFCVYFLRVPPTKAVRLAFDVFDVENVAHRDDCDFDSVRAFDGHYEDDQNHGKLLGKFCGKALPPPLLSTGGQMVLVFVSDRSVSDAGFSAKFQAVDLDSHCDRTFTAPDGEFTFDAADFEQTDNCDYRIVIPSNRRILLSVQNMSAPCESGTLMVRNGPSEQSPGFPGLFGDSEICDDHPTQRLISQGNRLFLRFRAANSRTMRFTVRYEQFETGCGGHITGLAGAISSPQFPHKDSQSMRCEWLIGVAPGNQVRLQISQMDDLDSEDSQGKCSPFARNLLEAGEGADWSELKARHCRKEMSPAPIQSFDNALSVRYIQHGGSHHGAIFGFMAQFSTVCSDIVLDGFQGTLQSPGYPYRVVTPRSCQWTIRTAPGSRIRVQFHLFRVASSGAGIRPPFSETGVGCTRNALEINPNEVAQLRWVKEGIGYAMNETQRKSMPRRLCSGTAEPSELVTAHNQLRLEFQSRNEPENHFWLSWQTIGCGGIVTANNSVLMANASTGADFVAEDAFRKCVWTIRAPLGQSIRVLVQRMEVEEGAKGQKCLELKRGEGGEQKAQLRDGVQFYVGDAPFARQNAATSELPLKALCGRLRNESFTWPGNSLSVVFSYHTDTSTHMANEVIGGLFGTFDELDDNVVFRATVTFVPSGGDAENSQGGVIKVDTRSDTYIQSPKYPKAYPKGIELSWLFEAPEGFVLAFQLLNLSSPASSTLGYGAAADKSALNSSEPEDYNCGYHMLYLRGGLVFSEGIAAETSTTNTISQLYSSRTRYRICRDVQMQPLNITMSGNESTVVFRGAPYELTLSGDSASAAAQKVVVGFRLRAFVKCGGTLVASAERKVLNTGNSGGSDTCEWRITRNRTDQNAGQRIFVRIEELDSGASNIAANYLDSRELPSVDVHCGVQWKGMVQAHTLNTLSSSIVGGDASNPHHYREFSCDEDMRVQVKNSGAHAGGAFLVSYDTESTFCGGQLSGARGRLSLSPVPMPSDCEWTVETVPGGRVVVAIVQFALPISEFCADSFLEFRESNASGPLIGRYCGIVPQQVESEGTMWIRLRHKQEPEDGEQLPALDASGQRKNPTVELKYTKTYGQTTSPVIESPPAPIASPVLSWQIAAKSAENWIRFVLTDAQLGQYSATLSVYPLWCTGFIRSPGEQSCRESDALAMRFSGSSPPQRGRVYSVRANRATVVFQPNQFGRFRLRWEEVSPAAANASSRGGGGLQSGETGGVALQHQQRKNNIFTCGGELSPKYETQTLQSPLSNMGMWYGNNERCKWTLRRPPFSTIVLNVTEMELEQHPNCQYDFMAMTTESFESEEEISSVGENLRLCRKTDLHQRVEVNSASTAYVYFYTDRSRVFRGFSLAYSLECSSIELWPVERGIMDTVLVSPGYPDPAQTRNYSCQWNVLLLSRRDLFIQSLDMDMAPRDWRSNECELDALEFSTAPFFGWNQRPANRSMTHCGQEQFNLTMGGGYVFVRYRSTLSRGRGFKLRLSERVHDCASSLVQLDQLTPRRVLSSPDFPHPAPNSLDCHWTLSAPAGRRLQFTVDPKGFFLQSLGTEEEECDDDFLEIRDGPSASAPLVGTFCRQNAPSTVLSTGEHLFVRFVTDGDIQSMGWQASVELASCGGSLVLVQGQNASVQSPNYPDVYPPKVHCEWTVRAPPGHFVEAMVEHMWMATTDNCSAEYLAIRDGNSTGDFLQKPVCSRLLLSSGSYRSSQQTLHIVFLADGTSPGMGRTRLFCLSRRCGFRLRLWSSKFACGGLVSDDAGRVFPPGYPDALVPNVQCQWDFRAGIGSRYVLELEFPQRSAESAFNSASRDLPFIFSRPCFENLEVANGFVGDSLGNPLPAMRRSRIRSLFCVNATTFVSSADIVGLLYFGVSDRVLTAAERAQQRALQLDVPFHIKYTKVPRDYDNATCMHEVTESGTLHINQNAAAPSSSAVLSSSSTMFCHIQVRKQNPESTVRLEFTDFRVRDGRPAYGQSKPRRCESWDSRVIVADEQSDPSPFRTVLCQNGLHGANRTSLVVLNSQLELYVLPSLTGMTGIGLFDWVGSMLQFDLTTTFHDCGGVIDAERAGMSGELTSPNFGLANYSDNLDCVWLLRAPEGMVVQLEFTAMDVESSPAECSNDMLEVSAGEDRSAFDRSVIHRYCNQDDGEEKLAERFKRVRSLGRSLTLHFHTDSTVSRKGFALNYAFVPFEGDNQCGFHANSPNGTIQSPRFPLDYPPNAHCVWDVQVPQGYHLLLTFDHFDVVQSADCARDFLRISEEHQARALAPLLNYWFYFDHEAPGKNLCGSSLPAPLITESNRIRVNFTTDARKAAKGFKLRWKAICGGVVFRNGHGVITSPHYPAYYPNEDAKCEYLIDPETQPGTTQIVTLKVHDFDLDRERMVGAVEASQQRRVCPSDYLEIRDVLRNVTVQLLCANTIAVEMADAVSIKGPIGVRFVTNRSLLHDPARKNHRGFKLSYAVSDCGGTVNLGEMSRQGSVGITSPGFPLPYHHSLDCLWNISAPSDRVISYKFTDVKIELGPECAFDAVETFDGAEVRNETRQLVLCGDKAPEGEIRTSGPRMLVRFRSDHSASFDGFKMIVTASLGPSSGCGGQLNATGDWQQFGAPVDPSTGRHFSNLRCQWTIKAPPGKVLEVRVNSLELEPNDHVLERIAAERLNASSAAAAATSQVIPCYDYAAIYDGPKATSPFLLAPSCSLPSSAAGDLLKPSLVSSFRRVDVFFVSDSSTELAGGFQADYRAVEAPCGGALRAGEQWDKVEYKSERTLTRTNQRHKRCRWFIYSGERQPVEAVFEQFSFPSTSADCVQEFLEMRDVGALSECEHPACAREQPRGGNAIRSCGKNAPNWHISATAVLQVTSSVVLQSQFAASFRLRYRVLSACNRTVEIDGTAPDGVSLASGRLTSPHFPHSPYSQNSSCSTRILAAPPHRIFAVFKTFQLERGRYLIPALGRPRWRFDRNFLEGRRRRREPQHPLGSDGWNRVTPGLMGVTGTSGRANCVYDSLTVYANASDPPVGQTFCGVWLPPSILSEANQMELLLETDATVAGAGYELSYYSVLSLTTSQGLTIYELAPMRERSGALTSIGYPGPYPAHSLLSATIVPPNGLRCTAELLRADFGDECRASVGRYPARSALFPVDASAGDAAPPPDPNALNWDPWPCTVDTPHKLAIPAGSMLLVEFRADGNAENDGEGFRLVWECEDVQTPLL